jgi:hypothetical protein
MFRSFIISLCTSSKRTDPILPDRPPGMLISLRTGNPERRMSLLGQIQTRYVPVLAPPHVPKAGAIESFTLVLSSIPLW